MPSFLRLIPINRLLYFALRTTTTQNRRKQTSDDFIVDHRVGLRCVCAKRWRCCVLAIRRRRLGVLGCCCAAPCFQTVRFFPVPYLGLSNVDDEESVEAVSILEASHNPANDASLWAKQVRSRKSCVKCFGFTRLFFCLIIAGRRIC
jgi:hypothetical protein